MIDQILPFLATLHPSDIIDVILLTFVIYRALLLIQGTRTIPILVGLTVLLGGTYLLATLFNLDAIGWLVENLVSSSVVILVILFQADIRNALAQVGLTTMLRELTLAEKKGLIDEITVAAFNLAQRRIGALFVVERETGLRNYIERGKVINATPTAELLESIFHNTSPLHDGAVIINKEGRLEAAQCILPLSVSTEARSYMGTRHRAALGMTEETDAAVIIVSEERGQVSLAYRGTIQENLDRAALRGKITEILQSSVAKDAITEATPQTQTA